MIRKWLLTGGIGLCILYLLNPGLGVFELIPDNIPGIGNLDEGAAVALLIYLVRKWREKPIKPASAPSMPKTQVIDVHTTAPQ